MPSIAVQAAKAVVSAANAIGVLTVDSTAYLFPGTLAWVAKDDMSARARVKILFISGTTTLTVRRFKNDDERSPPSYGGSDMTAFNGASHIYVEAQTAPVDPAYSKRVIP